MQITISEIEIKQAIADFMASQGLTFDNVPEVTLTISKGKVSASIEMGVALTLGLGPGQVEALPGKPKEDLKTFEDLDKPVKKATVKAKTKAKAPIKIVKEGPPDEKESAKETLIKTTEEVAPVEDLFDMGAAVPGQNAPEVSETGDSDSLFDGGATSEGAAATGSPVEESDQLFG